jgi:hypothetical protein
MNVAWRCEMVRGVGRTVFGGTGFVLLDVRFFAHVGEGRFHSVTIGDKLEEEIFLVTSKSHLYGL